jgi:hypothetical protein
MRARQFGFLFVALLLACTLVSAGEANSSRDAILADANRFCAMFSPKVWDEMKKNYQNDKLQHEFIRRMNEAVKTPEFITIISEQHRQPRDPTLRYQYYVQQISELTGQPFSCPNLKSYLEEARPH